MPLPRPALEPAYRVWGHPAGCSGDVDARRRQRASCRRVDVPAHQFVELRIVFPRSAAHLDRRARRSWTGAALAKIVAEEHADAAVLRARPASRSTTRSTTSARTLLILLAARRRPGARDHAPASGSLFGRERETGYDREYEQEPPTDTRARARARRCSARTTEPGLARVHGDALRPDPPRRYKSTPVTTERKVWGGLRHEEVADLELTPGDASIELTPFEDAVAEVIDSRRSTPTAERLSSFRERIEDDRDGEREALHGVQGARRRRDRASASGTSTAARRVLGVALVAFVLARRRPALDRASRLARRSRRAGTTSSCSRSASARSSTRALLIVASARRRCGGGAEGGQTRGASAGTRSAAT